MDIATVETLSALSGWAQRAYRECNAEYMQSPDGAPLSEFARVTVQQFRDLSWLLSERLTAERERLVTAVAAAQERAEHAAADVTAADRAVDRLVREYAGRSAQAAAHGRLERAEAAHEAACHAETAARGALAAFEAALGKEAGR